VALDGGLALLVLHTPGHSAGSISLWLAEEGALFSADAVPIPGDMPIYQEISESVRSIKRLASLPEIKLLLSAWDEPRFGGEAYRIMDEGLRYLERIHGCVLKVARASQSSSPIELCRQVLIELGLPQTMANPLVAASFQASLT
jgi:hydroxyacylglutathione hydrolase